MAFNLLIILLMFLDFKYIFSLISLLFTANYIQLQPDIIRVLIMVKLWDKEGIINIINRKLKYL